MSERMRNFTSGFVKENPVFALYLGICSVLAVSQNINNAIGMGVSVILVLICSNAIISLLRNIIPSEIRIPVYIVIIATLVTIVEMLINAFAPSLASSLGSFIALIVVNCIILGRAEAFASKHGVLDSMLDGLGMGLGYTFSILCIAIIREMLATGGLAFNNPFTEELIFSFKLIPSDFTIGMFNQPVGAFLTFGLLSALVAFIKNKQNKKEAK
ncbi:MAG: electron transport complex subunit E [Erysipelotrichaceae bacterium]